MFCLKTAFGAGIHFLLNFFLLFPHFLCFLFRPSVHLFGSFVSNSYIIILYQVFGPDGAGQDDGGSVFCEGDRPKHSLRTMSTIVAGWLNPISEILLFTLLRHLQVCAFSDIANRYPLCFISFNFILSRSVPFHFDSFPIPLPLFLFSFIRLCIVETQRG